jgi:hypothetical protein
MKLTRLLIFLFFAAWVSGQDMPANPAPQSQAPDQGPAPLQGSPRDGRRAPDVAGTITSIGDASIVIKTADGQTAQVVLNGKTQYRKDREPAKLSDFKVGDTVFVRGEKTGANAWQAEMVGSHAGGGPMGGAGNGDLREGMGKRFIAGEINSIEGTRLTIERPDGVAQTIAVDENTSFRKAGESITLADMKVGDHVFGRGEVKNGVFVPAVLNLGQPQLGGRRHENDSH